MKVSYFYRKYFSIFFCICIVINNFAHCKKFTRCELAKELKRLGVDKDDIPGFVCIADSNGLDTRFLGTTDMKRGGVPFGFFRINGAWWCDDDRFRVNLCKMKCTEFLDGDLSNDVECIKVIKNEHGFAAWNEYGRNGCDKYPFTNEVQKCIQ